MTYEQALKRRQTLEEASTKAGAVLRKFPRLASGLVPDAVRSTPEYRAAKSSFDNAFQALQIFNALFVRTFKGRPRSV